MIPDINLIPKEQEVEKKPGDVTKLIVFVLILAILIFYSINYFLLSRDIVDVQYKSDQLAAQIEQQQAELASIQNTPENILANSIEFVEGENSNVSKIIDVASKFITGSGELAGLDYSTNQATFTLYFDNLNEASTYIRNLSNEAIFKTVELKSATAFTAVDVDNVEDEQDLEGSAQYKAIVAVTLDEEELKSGDEKK